MCLYDTPLTEDIPSTWLQDTIMCLYDMPLTDDRHKSVSLYDMKTHTDSL